MAEICLPNVDPDHEVEIRTALGAVAKCTKTLIKVDTISMLRINWPDDHPELGAVIRALAGIAPEKPHIKSLTKRGRPRSIGHKLDPMGS